MVVDPCDADSGAPCWHCEGFRGGGGVEKIGERDYEEEDEDGKDMQCRSICADEERCRRTALPVVGHCAVHHDALVRWLGADFMGVTPLLRREWLKSAFVSRACAHMVQYLLVNPSTTYEALQDCVAELDRADQKSLKSDFRVLDRGSSASYLNLSRTLGAIFSRGARGLLEGAPQELLKYAAGHSVLDAVQILLEIVPSGLLEPGKALGPSQDLGVWEVLWGHPRTTGKDKVSAFMLAVVAGNAGLVEAYVSDPEVARARGPALVMAGGHGNVGLLRVLVDAGIPTSVQDDGAIRRACEFGKVDAVRFLLALDGVDPSALDNAAIGVASAAGHADVVRLLLADGRADPADQADYAVRAASEGGHVDVVRLLLVDVRVDPGAQENYAVRHAAERGETGVVQVLLEHVDVDPGDMEDYALRYASASGHTGTVQLLLRDLRVDPGALDNWALRLAAENGHTGVVRLLLRDDRVEPGDLDDYAVRLAAENGHADVVRLLLSDDRVDPSADSNDAVCRAAENGHADVVRLLLSDDRVDPSDQDNCAIVLAEKNGHGDVIDLLVKDPRVW